MHANQAAFAKDGGVNFHSFKERQEINAKSTSLPRDAVWDSVVISNSSVTPGRQTDSCSLKDCKNPCKFKLKMLCQIFGRFDL